MYKDNNNIDKLRYYKNYNTNEDKSFDIKFFGNINIINYMGEIKNDYRHGKGFEYYPNSLIKYEGDFLNDIPNGDGTLYDDTSCIIYSGQFVDGAPGGFDN